VARCGDGAPAVRGGGAGQGIGDDGSPRRRRGGSGGGGFRRARVTSDESDGALQHGVATRRVRRLQLEKGVDLG
jgi:hypothetical protein